MTSANRSRYPGENAPWCLALMDAAYGYQFLLISKFIMNVVANFLWCPSWSGLSLFIGIIREVFTTMACYELHWNMTLLLFSYCLFNVILIRSDNTGLSLWLWSATLRKGSFCQMRSVSASMRIRALFVSRYFCIDCWVWKQATKDCASAQADLDLRHHICEFSHFSSPEPLSHWWVYSVTSLSCRL